MRHLTRIEQLEKHIEILKEQKRALEALIYFRENEKKELEEKVKKKEV